MTNSIEKQRKHFNSISEEYCSARRHPNHLRLKELIWSAFLRRNQGLKGEVNRVLEPMCGYGEGFALLKEYLKADFDYLGFDYSENMVEYSKQCFPDRDVRWGNATNFEYKGEPFDLIILLGGLHHVYEHTQLVISELSKNLRKNGFFISFEPTHNIFITRAIRNRIYQANRIFDPDSEQGYEYQNLQEYFTSAGFVKVDELYPGLLAYVLYYNPDAFPFLNIGSKALVDWVFWIDRFFWSNAVGRSLSFATLTLWQLK